MALLGKAWLKVGAVWISNQTSFYWVLQGNECQIIPSDEENPGLSPPSCRVCTSKSNQMPAVRFPAGGETSPHRILQWLTLYSRVFLEQLTVCHLVKKFPAFYGTRRFITAFTSARYLSLSWVSSIHSIFISFSHLRLGLPSGLFPSCFPTIIPVYASPLPHTR